MKARGGYYSRPAPRMHRDYSAASLRHMTHESAATGATDDVVEDAAGAVATSTQSDVAPHPVDDVWRPTFHQHYEILGEIARFTFTTNTLDSHQIRQMCKLMYMCMHLKQAHFLCDFSLCL